MLKPKFSHFGTISNLITHRYERYLPTAYDESLSILQKMNLIIREMNRLGEITNAVVEDWQTLLEWVQNDGLEHIIIERLNEWLEDGTLDKIINQNIFGELNKQLADLGVRLKAIDGIASSRVYVYVNGNTGNDESADGSEAKPYKTIQKCYDDIPKVINQDRFVMVAPATYDEDVMIKSVSGSAIYIQSTIPSLHYQVRSMVYYDINGLVRVNDCDFTGTGDRQLRFSRCNYGTTNNCRFADSKIGTDKIAIEYDGTNGSVNSTYFDAQYTCIFSQNGSNVRVDSTNTHGENTSLRAVTIYAAHIYFNGQVEWIDKCTNPINVARGGRYSWDRTHIPLQLQNDWESVNDSTYQARAFKDDSNMVHLMGTIRNGVVGDVNALVLPEGYKPVFNTHVFGAYCDNGTIAKIVIDRTGQLQVQNGSNSPYISLSGISFYSGR